MRGLMRNQRGAGGIGCLLMIGLAAAGIYSGLEIGLPKLRHASFSDRMTETMGFFSRQSEKYIRERTIQVATEFHIDLKPEQVKVRIEIDRLAIDIAYDKHIDLKVWETTQHYTLHRSGPY